ncbi:myeloid leukemia factor 1 [Elysia marginata]|uniref:Myeloid leukemia factor 1 n=1 Tax=Elysia marginata TaxID=1093978 RepID=A0AAV4FQ21_9GAST|nr:myeloid leukemia factor 1 [Elysia marginata]
MFGPSMFDNDPFFSHHREHMRRMDEMFQTPFMGMSGGFGRDGPLSLEDGRHRSSERRHHHQRQEQRAQNAQVSRRHQFMDPFSHFDAMFSNMRSMMSDMHRAFEQGTDGGNPNSHMYQQSSFYSSSNMGNGPPKVFQASSSVRQMPGGVKETRKAVRDSETGVERVAMGHHINERAHIIERSRNAHTGETNENQELININEEEAPAFDSEYQDRWHSTSKGVEQRRRRIRELTHRPGHSHRALPEPEGTSSRRPRKPSNRKN